MLFRQCHIVFYLIFLIDVNVVDGVKKGLEFEVISGQRTAPLNATVTDEGNLENDKSKSVTDTSEIKTISSVNLVREWKKSKTAEGKRRRSSGSGRRKRYDTDRV